MEYLSLPFALRKGYLRTTDLGESISNSIGLILSTRRGSLPFDPEYGCDLWEKEYSDLFMVNKSDVQGSIRNAISKFEPRLYNISVSLINIQTGPDHPLGVAVKVIGNYRDEKDEKRFEEVFSIG
ncbi:MAG: GPW/gp25 family protein [Candidatus Krumholzibacteria bacterium]|jgi:phage baseplate assembly protein W|nr:GPW/gp25 family protein [Candidatus Krumholzibacteria bacterium]